MSYSELRVKHTEEELKYEGLKVAVEEALQGTQVKEPLTIQGKTDRPGYVYLKDQNLSVNERILEDRPLRPSIATSAVVESLLKLKKHQNLKDSTLLTYRKRCAQFVRAFPVLPTGLNSLLDYLGDFKGDTVRYKQTQQDILNMLYQHAVRHFGLLQNPLEGEKRPTVTKKPIRTLTLEEVAALDRTPETDIERAALEILLGHGWRQVEARRILAGDIRKAKDNIIWCWGKERNEDAPILPETLVLMNELTPKSLPDNQPVLRSRRIRNGSTQPLGEDGMSQLVGRLLSRAGLNFTGHDLRRTCATLIKKASGDEFLAMRLIRDKIPGQNDRYINVPLSDLMAALDRYSPLRLIKLDGGVDFNAGGDGGESNSPSRRSDPEYATGLASSLFSSG